MNKPTSHSIAQSYRNLTRHLSIGLTPLLFLMGCTAGETLPDDPYNPKIENVLSRATSPAAANQSSVGIAAAMAPGQLMKVHSLNVGAGSCHVVECPGPGNEKIVFDCGTVGRTNDSMQENELSSFGDGLFGANSKITVITSHPDRDHYVFVDDLVGSREVESIWLGGQSIKYSTDDFLDWLLERQNQDTPVFHELPTAFANDGIPIPELSCGLATGWILTANVGSTKNANSIGLLLYYDGFKVLMPGDAADVTQNSMIENFGALTKDVDLLFGSHHGSASHGSNKSPWPRHVNPQIMVYSSGDKFRHPSCSIVRNYRNGLIDTAAHPVWCNPIEDSDNNFTTDIEIAEYVTEVNGIVVVETDGETVSISCSKQPGGCF